MTRRVINAAIPLLGLCLMLSNNAYAQEGNNLELNLFGAGSIYTRNHYQIGYPQTATPFTGEMRFEPHSRFGGRFGVYTRGRWGEEFFYSFEPNTVRLQASASPGPTDMRLRIHNYGANALFYMVETESHGFQPFLSAGLGGTVYQIRQESLSTVRDPRRGNLPDINNSHELAFNYGLGFKARSAGWFGLRLDLRDFVARAPSFGLARQSIDPLAVVMPATGVVHNAELSLGFTIYFNRR
jgi:hypothetical protein